MRLAAGLCSALMVASICASCGDPSTAVSTEATSVAPIPTALAAVPGMTLPPPQPGATGPTVPVVPITEPPDGEPLTGAAACPAPALQADGSSPDWQAPYTQDQINDLSLRIPLDPPKLFGAGITSLAVAIQLAPGQEAKADDLLAKWGSALRITIGSHPYVPAGCGAQPDEMVCPDLVGDPPSAAGLELRVEPDQSEIHQWETGRGHLVVTNIGTQPWTLDSGSPLTGVLVAPGTDHVVGRFSGGLFGVGGGPYLRPGESGSIDLVFGADRCDGGPGSAVPPGVYGLRVAYTDEGHSGPVYLSPEVPVTVTE
ncbi:MAG: hypothetical protein JWL72_4272 [Ilumatobacteraceae bacterium]|nr:hypothetical protein [Ilumatobacteraceae bacterium]